MMPILRFAVTVFAACIIMLAPFVASAGEEGRDLHQPVEPSGLTVAEEALVKSSYSVGLMGGYGVELGKPPDLELAVVLPSVSFPISGVKGKSFYKGVWEYRVEPVFGLVTNLSDRGEIGLSPIGLRYNFTAPSSRLVPYVEGMLGATYINLPRSIQGTRFNFIESGAFGVRYFVSRKVALDLQLRVRHLSNAAIRKPNPGLNTGFLLIGVDYY